MTDAEPPQDLTPRAIAAALGLAADGLDADAGDDEEACAAYLLDRPLSVEPVIRPLMDAGGVDAAGQERVVHVLRLFRAAVRGLDDLLDRSETEPSGRPAAWTRFGESTTTAAALRLWERAAEAVADDEARAALLRESRAMLDAARLEDQLAQAGSEDARPIEELAGLERQIREKEVAYWRLVAALVRPEWRGDAEAFAGRAALLVRLAHVWQRTDDARDFEEDLREGRLSSFLVDLLREPLRGEPSGSLEIVSWRVRLQGDAAIWPARVAERRRELLRRLAADEARLRAALAAPPPRAEAADDDPPAAPSSGTGPDEPPGPAVPARPDAR